MPSPQRSPKPVSPLAPRRQTWQPGDPAAISAPTAPAARERGRRAPNEAAGRRHSADVTAVLPALGARAVPRWRTLTLALGCAAALVASTTLLPGPAALAAEEAGAGIMLRQGTLIAPGGSQSLRTGDGVSSAPYATNFSLEEAAAAEASPDRSLPSAGTIVWPFRTSMPLTDRFGYRSGPYAGMHTGQDFAAGEGETILSIAAGVVTDTGFIPGLDGQHVVIEHRIGNSTVRTVSAHMITGSQTVQVGDRVTAGQPIGLVGATGAATGPHLHLDVQIGETFVDPLDFLNTFAGENLAAGTDLLGYLQSRGGFRY